MKHLRRINEDSESIIYPKGYVRHYDRNSCDSCEFFQYDNKKAPQERKMVCAKVTPNVEVYYDDVCDEYKKE